MSSAEILCNESVPHRHVRDVTSTADLTQPDFLTVEQAAAVIGIGRTCAYQLARRAADLGEGTFPAVRFGKQLRVPRRKLEDLTGGPITIPALTDHTNPDSHHPTRTTRPPPATPITHPRPPPSPPTDHRPPAPTPPPLHHPMTTTTTNQPHHPPNTDECTVAFGNRLGGRR